ncbi:hypothetical protein [Ralstonia pseudosolanacearum]|uniref:hypothetical protein n=1 Tax=Ralstonia pseudosolanacearum TaxID=1310165 RepID=UPI003391524D
MKLISMGFFKDLPYGNESGGCLVEHTHKFSGLFQEDVLSYLKSGVSFLVAPSLSRDVISSELEIIGSLALLTDGKFLWPSDLAYYVERHRVELPQEFFEYMAVNSWKVPAVDVSVLEI